MVRVTTSPARALIPFMIGASLTLAGCARSLHPDEYARYETGAVSYSENGTVVSTRNVKIAGTRTGIGTGVGAIAGGVGGSHIGDGGLGSFFGALGFALLGGLVGTAAEEAATQQSGIEYTIAGDDGRTITVVQAQGGAVIVPGQRVTIIHGPERARVVPETQAGLYPSAPPQSGTY